MNARDAILGIELPREEANIPEANLNGEKVYVRGMDADEQEIFSEKMNKPGTAMVPVAAETVCKMVIDGDGNRVFEDEDAPRLRKLSGPILSRLLQQVAGLSSMGTSSIQEVLAAAVEQALDDLGKPEADVAAAVASLKEALSKYEEEVPVESSPRRLARDFETAQSEASATG